MLLHTRAWIQLREGTVSSEEDIRAFCREKISHFKVPRHIRFTDQFPMTVTGKIQKFRLREIAIEELGLSEIEKPASSAPTAKKPP